MENYYKILEIERDAGEKEIKRAYFRLVKEFTPEKHPEKFKKIRKAYETLSDLSLRKAYDSMQGDTSELDAVAAELLEKARNQMWNNRYNSAIETLTAALSLYPDSKKLEFELAKAFIENGNLGKALKICEKLLKSEPENADYLKTTSLCCMERGWSNKALDYMSRAVHVRPADESLRKEYISLLVTSGSRMDVLQLYRENIDDVVLNGGKAPNLILDAIGLTAISGHDDSELYAFAEMLDEHSKDIENEQTENLLVVLDDALLSIFHMQKFDMFAYINKLIENIDAVKSLKKPGFQLLETGYNARCAVKKGIPRIFAVLSLAKVMCLNDQYTHFTHSELEDEIFMLECDILLQFEILRPHIQKFEEEFPTLYNNVSEFLTQALSNSPIKMLESRKFQVDQVLKRTSGYGVNWDFIGEDNFGSMKQEPIHVEKIGRNAPCPCGSGLKYKKCCG